jgi:hypothetical protein
MDRAGGMASAGDDGAGWEGRREVVLRVRCLLCELLLLNDDEIVVVGLIVVDGPLRLTLRAELFDDAEEDSQETDCVIRETKVDDDRGEAEGLCDAGAEGNALGWVLLSLGNVGRALRNGTLADRDAGDLSTGGLLW